MEEFEINDEFAALLNDPGAAFTHPRARQLRLEDIFVYPDIKTKEAESGQGAFLPGDDLLKYVQENKQVFLVGDEKAGKTILARRLFIDSKAIGLTPLIVDGADIRSANPDALIKTLQKSFGQEYIAEHFEKYLQGNSTSRIVLIDDFHECRLNPKAKAQFMKLLLDFSPNLLVLADGSFDIETMMQGPSEITGVLTAFRRCSIKELGHAGRLEMIEKWCSLGLDDCSEDEEFTDRVRFIEKTIDTLKGKHLIPSYPIFVLAILQQIEAGTNLKTFSGAFGYIYEALITGSLIRADNNTSLDTKYVFLSHLAFRAFTSDQKIFSEEDIDAVCDEYYREYKIRIVKGDLIPKLQNVLVLLKLRDVFSFRYKYLFYYFVAKYFQDRLAANDNSDNLRKKLTELTTRLYNEDAANILIFYIYLTKDQLLISQIISSSKSVFLGQELWKIDKHTKFLSMHSESAPKLEFDTAQHGKKKQILRHIDELEDSFENKEDQDPNPNAKQDRPDQDKELNEMLQVNVAMKAIQIMGQILRNFPGSLKAEVKNEIAKECFLLSLRTLGIMFGQFEKHWQELLSFTEKAIAEKFPKLDEQKLKQRASDVSLFVALGTALGIVKGVSFSVGSDHLKETYKSLIEENPTPEFALIDLSIKLDHCRPAPEKETAKLGKQFSDNWFGLFLLRIMVLEYMHMFPCDIRTIQRLCHDVGIPLKQAMLIESRNKPS